VSGVPVVDEVGHVIGIVTEADLVAHEAYGDEPRRVLSVLADRLLGRDEWVQKATGLRAADLMTTEVVSVRPQDDVAFAARLMLERGVRRLPVVEDGRLVGIVARGDLLRWFARTDDDLARAVEHVLTDAALPGGLEVEVVVRDGIVLLLGRVRRRVDRDTVVEATRSVPGVVAVDDRLLVTEPDPVLEQLHPPLG
jgi:CBS domain-containing protein